MVLKNSEVATSEPHFVKPSSVGHLTYQVTFHGMPTLKTLGKSHTDGLWDCIGRTKYMDNRQ